MTAGSGYRFGELVLNLDRGCLQKDGADIVLRPKAFEVLRYLVERAGRLATKDELVQAVWPNVIVNDDALAQCVRDIRKVLNDDGERFIRTVPRRGYMFVADTVPIGTVQATSIPVWRGALRLRWPAAPVAALTLLAVVAAVLVVWGRGWSGNRPPVTDTRLTVAVLPFTTLGDRPADDWLGDGIAEDIMTAVSRFRDLTVIGRHSSFRYRGEAVDLRQAAKELGAHYLLQGSIRRGGDRVRITVQLVDPATGASRWSERYDRPFTDLFTIQDEVANKVAAQLVAHAREAAVTRLRAKAPENLEVYELVLRGRRAYRSHTREGAAEARGLSERAIAIDPSYAAAWEVLAQALLQFYMQPYSAHQGTVAMLQEARAAAERAATLDANFATGQATLGFALLCAREHQASVDALRKAIDLNPNDAEGHAHYGQALFLAGHYRESIKAWEQAERLDPFGPPIWLAFKALPYIMLRELDPALRLTRWCAQQAPKLPTCSIYLAIAAREMGLENESRAAARRVLEIYPGFSIQRHMRIIPFGREADAARWVEYLRRAGLPE